MKIVTRLQSRQSNYIRKPMRFICHWLKIVPEDELSHLLDYLLDFACDEKMLGLYKRVCRKYLDVYPGCIKDYIEAYQEMWGEENSYGENC